MTKDKSYEDNLAPNFLFKYYTSIITTPESEKDFYHSNSVISRRYGSESHRVVGYENLKENKLPRIRAVNMTTIDSQTTINNGIFISCTGITQIEDNQSRQFHQSFLLEKVESSYYITNDILVISQHVEPEQPLPDEASTHVEEPHLNGASTSTSNDHCSKEEEVVAVKEEITPVVVVATEQSATKQHSETANDKQEPSIEKQHIEEEPQQVTPTTQPQQINKKDPKQSPQQQQPPVTTPTSNVKPSLADLIKTTTPVSINTTTTSPVTTTTATTTSPTTSTTNQVSTTSPNTSTQQVATTNIKDHQGAFAKDGCTIYYSHFKFQVKFEPHQIREALQQFGNIQNIKIFNFYGFVEFDKVESVQRILDHVNNNNKIIINGTLIHIEERKGQPPKSLYKQHKRPNNSQNNNSTNISNNNSNNNNNSNQNIQNNKFQNTNSKPRDNNQQNNRNKNQNNDKKN